MPVERVKCWCGIFMVEARNDLAKTEDGRSLCSQKCGLQYDRKKRRIEGELVHRPSRHRVTVRDAEKYFPVRIRIVPDWLATEHQNDDMHRWLDANIGPGRYWFIGGRMPPHPDTFLVYFVAVADAQAFVDRFSSGIWIAEEWPHRHPVPPLK
jgi:hypothetical protein